MKKLSSLLLACAMLLALAACGGGTTNETPAADTPASETPASETPAAEAPAESGEPAAAPRPQRPRYPALLQQRRGRAGGCLDPGPGVCQR